MAKLATSAGSQRSPYRSLNTAPTNPASFWEECQNLADWQQNINLCNTHQTKSNNPTLIQL